MKVKCIKEYDAIQWTGEDSPFVLKGLNFPIFSNNLPQTFYVKTEFTTVPIKEGQWILLEDNKPMYVLTSKVFNRDWKPV